MGCVYRFVDFLGIGFWVGNASSFVDLSWGWFVVGMVCRGDGLS